MDDNKNLKSQISNVKSDEGNTDETTQVQTPVEPAVGETVLPEPEITPETTTKVTEEQPAEVVPVVPAKNDNPNAKWYVVHTYSGHENKVALTLKQRI